MKSLLSRHPDPAPAAKTPTAGAAAGVLPAAHLQMRRRSGLGDGPQLPTALNGPGPADSTPVEEDLHEFTVELAHTISTEVTVRAASPAAAVALVEQRDFPLPPRAEWTGHKDWEYQVFDANGNALDPDA